MLVTVVKDGRLTMYAAGGGELVEVARILVPDEFSAEATAALGLNIVAATGMTDGGPAPVAAQAGLRALPRATPGPTRMPRQAEGFVSRHELIAREVALHPGVTTALLIGVLGWDRKSVGNALQRAKDVGLIRTDGGSGKPGRWYPVGRT